MKKLNITPGQWAVSWQDLADETTVYKINDGLHSYDTAECNNELIADAGTTYNQCGMLPSELLKQRDELLATLRSAYFELDALTSATGNTFNRRMLTRQKYMPFIQQAIKNAENI